MITGSPEYVSCLGSLSPAFVEQEPCLSKPCYQHANSPQMEDRAGDRCMTGCWDFSTRFPALSCWRSFHHTFLAAVFLLCWTWSSYFLSTQEHWWAYIACIMFNPAMPSRVSRRQFAVCWRFLAIIVSWWSGFIIFVPPFLSNRLSTVREVCLHQLLCSCLYAWSALKRDERACCHCVRE